MKRHLVFLLALATALICVPVKSADADGFRGGKGRGISRKGGIRHTGSHGFGHGAGFGGFGCDFGWDLAELYRELLKNVPYYSLHPPVYYSYPVPRTYGYSPFAYPGYIMTPDAACQTQPLEIINPHVPGTQKPASVESDRTAATSQPEPLVIINPFATPTRVVAENGR
jgi:hypothetical protein